MKMSETTLSIKILLLKGSKPNSHLRSTRIFKSICSIELIFSKKLLHILMINLFAGSLLQLKLDHFFGPKLEKHSFFFGLKKNHLTMNKKFFCKHCRLCQRFTSRTQKKNSQSVFSNFDFQFLTMTSRGGQYFYRFSSACRLIEYNSSITYDAYKQRKVQQTASKIKCNCPSH